MTVDPIQQGIQQMLLQQVAKTLIETTPEKDSPFAALLTTALADGVKA
jgi:hypothetical protein